MIHLFHAMCNDHNGHLPCTNSDLTVSVRKEQVLRLSFHHLHFIGVYRAEAWSGQDEEPAGNSVWFQHAPSLRHFTQVWTGPRKTRLSNKNCEFFCLLLYLCKIDTSERYVHIRYMRQCLNSNVTQHCTSLNFVVEQIHSQVFTHRIALYTSTCYGIM